MKLKINDTIKVLIGDDAGKEGKILKVFPSDNTVLVDGINTYKRHLKKQGNQEGGIVTISRPIRVSKVMIVCPHCKKPTRIGLVGEGRDKTRVCRHCSKPLTVDAKAKTNKKK